MTRALLDAGDPAAGPRTPALQGRPLVDDGGLDDELVADHAVVRLGVRDRGSEHLLELAGRGTRGEGEDSPRLGHAAAADVLCDDTRLARGGPHPFRLS